MQAIPPSSFLLRSIVLATLGLVPLGLMAASAQTARTRAPAPADANRPAERPNQVNVGVSASGQYMVNRTPVTFTTREAFANELRRAASGNPDPVIIINADANATHQSVIHVMEAAQMAGFGKITFTAQLPR